MGHAIKSTLFVVVFFTSLVCFARDYYEVDKAYTGTYAGLGGFTSPNGGYRGGGELAATIWHQHSAFRTSGIIYATENDEFQSELFAGYSVTAIAYRGDRLKSYIGLGAYLGESLDCERYVGDEQGRRPSGDRGSNYCYGRSRLLLSLFPEVGFAVHLGPFQINPFMRVYFDTENQNDNNEHVIASFGALIHWELY